MSSGLSAIPAVRRQHLAGVLGLFAVLLVAVGAVAATGATSAPLMIFVVIAFVAGLILALLAWGVLASVRNERAEQRHQVALDSAVAQALAAAGQIGRPGCGHDHDPDELHVTVDSCAQDGGGTGGIECSRTCEACVFASRPRPTPNTRR